MRKLLISLFLASAAATPALADPPKDRQQAREEREQAREERQQAREQARSDRAESPRAERVRPQTEVREQPSDRAPRQQAFDRSNGGGIETVRDRIDTRRDAVESRREQRAEERGQFRQTRTLPPVMRTRTPVISQVPREGTQPPPRVESRRSAAPNWSTSWRHNNRYDWYNWRKRHRSLFNLGFYYDPFGWGYSPYQIGWRMWPSYYSSRYWLNDPWMYRLPYAPPGYRWIRYWDDAVLVDTWSGQVVDVIHNFFW